MASRVLERLRLAAGGMEDPLPSTSLQDPASRRTGSVGQRFLIPFPARATLQSIVPPLSYNPTDQCPPVHRRSLGKNQKRLRKFPRRSGWQLRRHAAAGLVTPNAARKFGVSVFAIMQRSQRNKWPVGSRIQRRVEALQEARYKARERYKPYEQQRNSNAQVTEAIAESWAERGEQHRAVAFQLAHDSLKAAAKKGMPIESWRDADLADKTARRNAGLDDSKARKVSIGMTLINQRLDTIQLPPQLDD